MISYKNLEKEGEEMALQSLKIDLIKILIDFNDESSNKFADTVLKPMIVIVTVIAKIV